jgi:hypothetical protein
MGGGDVILFNAFVLVIFIHPSFLINSGQIVR